MHILLFNYVYQNDFRSIEDLLTRYTSLVGWAEALAAAGARVSVFQRFGLDQTYKERGIVYHFISDSFGPGLQGWQIPVRLHQVAVRLVRQGVRQGRSVVAHVNGLIFPLQIAHVRLKFPSCTGIVVQHHAEKPSLGWRRWVQRLGLAAADGFFFTAFGLAKPWTQMGVIRPNKMIYQIMEGSSSFKPEDRSIARQRTGLRGSPVILWVGRLDCNKDPLTVLRGFEQLLPDIPAAKLYMIFHTAELLPKVQEYLNRSQRLREAVHLLGTVPHAEIADYFNSADYFVLGSHYEGSGYALVEAMACGVIPVITDIPSFRMMTDGGRVGALWPAGDSAAFTAALGTVVKRVDPLPSKAVRQLFDCKLSYPAIAGQALEAYQSVLEKRI